MRTTRTLRAETLAPQRRRKDQATRRQLLDAAGQVFAEKGFEGATGKEICELAGTNTAAVNYYFGGIDGLYSEVLADAHSRFMTFAVASAAVAGKATARDKLEAIFGLLARIVTGPAVSSWAIRVLLREFLNPSSPHEPWREKHLKKELLPKVQLVRGIVSEITGLPEDHPAVARGCTSVMGACYPLILLDRRTLSRMFPNLGLGPKDEATLARHLLRFALAGLAAIAADARKKD
jgi:AcrR family transcriptional regulator